MYISFVILFCTSNQWIINTKHTYMLIEMSCNFPKLCYLSHNLESSVIMHAEIIMLLTLAKHNGIEDLLLLLQALRDRIWGKIQYVQ